MFTGIIERTVRVISVVGGLNFQRLTLTSHWADVKPGESIAVNGVCLTVADMMDGELAFDVITETLSRTNLGLLKGNDLVNVERSLQVGSRLDGHFVLGHVDGVAKLIDVATTDGEWRLTLEAPHDLAKYLTPKGSVSIDGVSLTIAAIKGNTFQVALIPTTLDITTLGQKSVGWPFNLEADVFARTIVSYLERREELRG